MLSVVFAYRSTTAMQILQCLRTLRVNNLLKSHNATSIERRLDMMCDMGQPRERIFTEYNLKNLV